MLYSLCAQITLYLHVYWISNWLVKILRMYHFRYIICYHIYGYNVCLRVCVCVCVCVKVRLQMLGHRGTYVSVGVHAFMYLFFYMVVWLFVCLIDCLHRRRLVINFFGGAKIWVTNIGLAKIWVTNIGGSKNFVEIYFSDKKSCKSCL